MFLASKLIKNLHTATFASMLMKSSGFLHEAAGIPFLYASISLAYFVAEKSFFSKHIEAEQEIHHAYVQKRVF